MLGALWQSWFIEGVENVAICTLFLTLLISGHQEWDDYRENKKDYSGLKIESLKIEEPQEEEEDETEINEVRTKKN